MCAHECMKLTLSLCFRGVGPGCNTREIADKLIDLKAELDDLALRENELDQQRVWVQQSIKNVTDDSNNSPYPSLHCVCVYGIATSSFFSDVSHGECRFNRQMTVRKENVVVIWCFDKKKLLRSPKRH